MAGVAAHLIVWSLVSSGQKPLNWAGLCPLGSGISELVNAGNTALEASFFWLALSFPPKAPEIIRLREQILCTMENSHFTWSSCLTWIDTGFHLFITYSRSFLFPPDFSCFYILLLFLFFLPKRLGKRGDWTWAGTERTSQWSQLLLSSPTCTFLWHTYSLSKPEVLYPSF